MTGTMARGLDKGVSKGIDLPSLLLFPALLLLLKLVPR